MRKTIKYMALIAAFAGASLATTSCSDFLDKQASNELTEEKTLADWRMFEYFHTDTYNFLRHGAQRMSSSWLDAATDLAETSFSTGGARTSFNIGNYYSGGGWSELQDTWESRYRAIRKCNFVLEKMHLVPKDITMSDEEDARQRAIMRAEAKTFRAFFYWEMFLRYGPLPIVTEVLDPENDMITPYKDRPSYKEYTDFILSELRESRADLMSYDEAWNGNRIGHLSQPMSLALESRILLYLASPFYADKGCSVSWQEAADCAKEFIETYGGNFRLYAEDTKPGMENYANAVLHTAYTGNNAEVIFFRNDTQIGWGSVSTDSPVGEGGRGGNCPSQNLVDMYDMIDGQSPFASYDATGAPVYGADGRPTINAASGYTDQNMWANRDPRFNASVLFQGVEWGSTKTVNVIDVTVGGTDNPVGNADATPTGYYMRKYIPASILASNHSGSAYRLWTIIRYAEILMNYAEALNEVGGPTDEVCALLDQIRHRAGIYGNVADRADLKDKTAMRNFIHKERTVEFAFEEHRWWDVRRWKVAKEALGRDIYGVDVAKNGTITRKVAQKRVFEDKMYLYPIPETEYWKTDMENNPGW